MIIDFHTHTFPEKISQKVADKLAFMAHIPYSRVPNTEELLKEMKEDKVDYSVNLPVVTRPEQTVSINDNMIKDQEEHFGNGIIDFGGMHPENEHYRSELRRISANGIKGIKLHPPYQGTDLSDIRYKRILGAATEENLIVVVHAGWDIGLPGHNFATVPMILEILKDVSPEKLVLAHMGGWQDWEQVKMDLAGAPVWLDTAFSFGKIKPRKGEEEDLWFNENLSEVDFIDLIRSHGTDHILFGTDFPWGKASEPIHDILNMNFSEDEKEKILFENAASLLKL